MDFFSNIINCITCFTDDDYIELCLIFREEGETVKNIDIHAARNEVEIGPIIVSIT